MNQQNIARAFALLNEARSLLESEIADVGNPPQPPTPVVPIVPPVNQNPVVYGRANYTDVGDPRAQNARRHWEKDGKVLMVHLQVHTRPDKPWRAVEARVIDEMEAQGKRIAYVVQSGGTDTVGLFTGYNGEIDRFDSFVAHAPGQEVVIDGRFDVPNLGPLAIALTDAAGTIISDVVASMGLPGGHHVCYAIRFERR